MLDVIADPDRCYRAVASRDARFDGWFVTAVRSTRIYCRPSCPARLPRRDGVRFYATPAAAQGAGYRACKRCRPDASPGSPQWDIRADLTARAMRLIGDGLVDREGVSGLAARVGYTPRHLTRVVTQELGAGPLAVARAQRAQTARLLLETTEVPVTEVAFAAGFSSLRQFNDTVREIFATTPTGLRQRRRSREAAPPGTIALRLSFRRPCDVGATLRFLGQRAVPGVEHYCAAGPPDWSGAPTFTRGLELPHGAATVALSAAPEGADYVRARLVLADLRDLTVAVARCRRLLDLDADPVAVDSVLGDGPLAASVAKYPGLRVPGTVDGSELAVRAVLGQQISVAGARTIAGRLAARYGRPLPAPQGEVTHAFPAAETLAGVDPAELPMPVSRARALVELCASIASGDPMLDGAADRGEVESRLLEQRGIGPWTAGYIRMRALRDPDVWLGTDLEVVKSLARLRGRGPVDPSSWSPWRSYAVLHLWSGGPV